MSSLSSNRSLYAFDLSGGLRLMGLNLSGDRLLGSLDLGSGHRLGSLDLGSGRRLGSLDLSSGRRLKVLNLASHRLRNLSRNQRNNRCYDGSNDLVDHCLHIRRCEDRYVISACDWLTCGVHTSMV